MKYLFLKVINMVSFLCSGTIHY